MVGQAWRDRARPTGPGRVQPAITQKSENRRRSSISLPRLLSCFLTPSFLKMTSPWGNSECDNANDQVGACLRLAWFVCPRRRRARRPMCSATAWGSACRRPPSSRTCPSSACIFAAPRRSSSSPRRRPGRPSFSSLGTNDAHGSIARLDKSIDAIVRAAERKNITLIWMGPPCVRQSWDTRARELDAILRTKLANTSVHYVSMRDERMCSGDLHERRRRSPEDEGLRPYVGEGAHGRRICGRHRRSVAGGCPDRAPPGSAGEKDRADSASHSTKTQPVSCERTRARRTHGRRSIRAPRRAFPRITHR